jgi:peptidoglycan/xylan/chitin deacetylase (PgdA/CDA1 family)
MPAARAVIPILMYHNIARPPADTLLRSLYVTPAAFRRQLRLLHALGYVGVSMSEAMPYLRGERSGRVAVLTFDDGYVDNLENAVPVLQDAGFSATCYFVSGGLGGYNSWDDAVIKTRKPIMDRAQVRAWADAGLEVGSHSHSHPQLTRCDDAVLDNELARSRDELQQIAGTTVTQFCYPYGDHDERVAKAVARAGYVAATTTHRGRARAGDDLFTLRRVLVGGHNWLPQVAVKLLTAYEDRRG